jgi:hypothetical protein
MLYIAHKVVGDFADSTWVEETVHVEADTEDEARTKLPDPGFFGHWELEEAKVIK